MPSFARRILVKPNYAVVLDLFCWGVDVLSGRDCGLILAGMRVCPGQQRASELLGRLERLRLVQRMGRGTKARFQITAKGRHRAAPADPTQSWDRPWDGKWRVITYDLPEQRRKDRIRLWQALRDRKLGLLQRSVWIWPQPVNSILQEVIAAQGIPECFCGFEAGQLFLCTNAEVVATAWNFEEITRRQRIHLDHVVANPDGIRNAGELSTLAHLARLEWHAYKDAFSLDPLLPRQLCPRNYRGFAVQKRHLEFRDALRRRLQELCSS
jgi:phenylacetic acid degradation operon negative regulatory protein